MNKPSFRIQNNKKAVILFLSLTDSKLRLHVISLSLSLSLSVSLIQCDQIGRFFNYLGNFFNSLTFVFGKSSQK